MSDLDFAEKDQEEVTSKDDDEMWALWGQNGQRLGRGRQKHQGQLVGLGTALRLR